MKKPFQSSPATARVEDWLSKFPFDYAWRQKYKIPFGSPQHRQMDFFDMKFDLSEGDYIEYLVSLKKYAEHYENQLLKKQVLIEDKEKQNEQDFDDLDLDEFNETES